MKKLLVIFLIVATACATAPITGRKQFIVIPSSEMIALSATSYKQVLDSIKTSSNQKYNAEVKSVGQNLTAAVKRYLQQNGMESRIEGYDWQYNVLVSKEVNAWCMPGGQIAFYEGILPYCQDENGIAVVMGHEIAHAVAQHGNERMSQQLAVQMGGVALAQALSSQKAMTQQLALTAFGVGTNIGIILPFSRTQEYEADELGLYFMAMAGYDPRSAPAFWERMEKLGSSSTPAFLSTHPTSANRMAELNKKMPKALEYYQANKK
jgi:predicted Zn-dependent protease